MLVEEAKVGGTKRLQCPRVDQDLRLLAGVAKPASVTVCEDSHESPCVEGTLSSPDLAGKLYPVVSAGIPLPVGPVGPVGLYGMKSPSDFEPVGQDGPYSGPVGSLGTLSPFYSNPWNVGVSPGENELARKDVCAQDEYIECHIIGLSLYTWLKCFSLEVLSDCM